MGITFAPHYDDWSPKALHGRRYDPEPFSLHKPKFGGGWDRTSDTGRMSPCWQVRRRSPPSDFLRPDAEKAEKRTGANGSDRGRSWGQWMLAQRWEQAWQLYFRRCTIVVSVSAGSGVGSPYTSHTCPADTSWL